MHSPILAACRLYTLNVNLKKTKSTLTLTYSPSINFVYVQHPPVLLAVRVGAMVAGGLLFIGVTGDPPPFSLCCALTPLKDIVVLHFVSS